MSIKRKNKKGGGDHAFPGKWGRVYFVETELLCTVTFWPLQAFEFADP